MSWSFLAKSKSAEFDYDYLEPIGQTKLMCLPKSLAIILFVLADMKKMPSETWDRLVSHIVRLRKHVIGVNVGRKIAATRDMKSRDPRRPKDGGTL